MVFKFWQPGHFAQQHCHYTKSYWQIHVERAPVRGAAVNLLINYVYSTNASIYFFTGWHPKVEGELQEGKSKGVCTDTDGGGRKGRGG